MAGSGYDGHLVLSPEGRIFQVEYAMKTLDFSTTILGLLCKDGVVLAAERQVLSPLHEENAISSKRIFNIDTHIGCVMAGLLTDSRALVDFARSESTSFRNQWAAPIPVDILAKRTANFMFQHTIYNGCRPFGCSMTMGGYNQNTDSFEMWQCEPNGVAWRYKGVSLGSNKNAAKTELERLDPKLGNLCVIEGARNACKIIHGVRDQQSTKKYAIDISFIGGIHGKTHKTVSEQMKHQFEEWAKLELESDSEDSGSESSSGDDIL